MICFAQVSGGGNQWFSPPLPQTTDGIYIQIEIDHSYVKSIIIFFWNQDLRKVSPSTWYSSDGQNVPVQHETNLQSNELAEADKDLIFEGLKKMYMKKVVLISKFYWELVALNKRTQVGSSSWIGNKIFKFRLACS